MGMTVAEKILAAHSADPVRELRGGSFVNCRLDLVMGHDVSAPRAIRLFRAMGAKRVFDKDKVVILEDHFVPASSINSAIHCQVLKEFAREQELTHYYPVGTGGICHALLPELGLIKPGQLIAGGDSHTCTYGALGALSTGVGATDLAVAMALGKMWFKVPESLKVVFTGRPGPWAGAKDLILRLLGLLGVEGARYQSVELCGEPIENLSPDGRLTMANMLVELGAKCGFLADAKPGADLADADARYTQTITVDVTDLEPQAACPHSPANVTPVSQAGKVAVDQVVLGSCTNGRLEDLRLAAELLKGHKVAKGLRLIVIPATQKIYREALAEGLLEIFAESGAIVAPSTCGPCCGAHMGVLGPGETAVSTTNRNFVSRMGHKESRVFLVGPAAAAATAVAGYLASPAEHWKEADGWRS
ncbi:MAG: 3-isopropylmalate dehydratase large subunit [Gracilibacteraceae bacterium]|jgi:3-isopropylmalate/(R)-2-methylmalate dehydratase large subunit|nr:3-isopropylmalate dehydratase large subunit [Gracilibacteraceae bacterium]